MFWKLGGFAYKEASGIESLLEKPAHEITLEKVLDEEDLLQEIKVHNARLLDYLRQESVLARLLELIIHDYQDDEKKGFKYAYVACEVLSCEVWSICETIFENPHLLRTFWTFIDAEPPLNPLRASYFTKVNEKFLEKKTDEMIPFIQSIPDVLKKILRHSDTSAIMDLLLKIISMERTDVGAGVVEWLYDEGLLDSLTAHLHPDVDPDIQTTVADVIKAIIAISANSSDQGVIGPNALSRNLVSEPTISALVRNMICVTETGSNGSLTTGVSIVIELIRKNNSDYDLSPIMNLVYNKQPPSSRDPIYLGTMLRVFANSIGDFQALLLSPKNVRMIKTPGYGEIEALGFERFRICELYAELLHCSNMALLNDPQGESVVRERDIERERLKREAKSEERLPYHMRESSGGEDTEKDDASARRSMSANRSFNPEDLDEAILVDKEQLQVQDSFPARNRRRSSSSEEGRHRPEERRGSRGSMDEESRPYMPALQPHVIEGLPVATDEQFEEQKIIADIGPQSHQIPKPEGPKVSALAALQLRDESAIISRTPSPPALVLDSPMSPSSDIGAPLIREPPTTIEQDITTATQDTIIPSSSSPEHEPSIDLNIDLDAIARRVLPEDTHRPSDQTDSISRSSSSASTPSSRAPSDSGEPVVGDFLKLQFMNQHVISTMLDLFFKFPWNNFLHNVVYDVVQQVFNGPMDRGYNRVLAIDVFAQGLLCEKIVAGQKASDAHVNGDGVRLGYMGHLSLVAEEVVKFAERYAPDQLSPIIAEKVAAPEWVEYVETTLAATRARDLAVLGGKLPELATPQHQQQPTSSGAWDIGERSYDVEDDDEELQRRMGQFALTDESETSDQFANYISQQISSDAPDKFGSSDEEDEDEDQEMSEWMHDRGDFLRSRAFDRYDEADDEQVETLEDTDLAERIAFDEPKNSEVVDFAAPVDSSSADQEDLSDQEEDVEEEEDAPTLSRSDPERPSPAKERAASLEGDVPPQSANPAFRRASLEEDDEEADA